MPATPFPMPAGHQPPRAITGKGAAWARRAWHRLGFALALALALAGSVAIGPATAQPATDASERIRALESLGRARPVEAAAELEQLLASTPELSPQRLELLTVQGLLLSTASQTIGVERAARRLEAWSMEATPSSPQAGAAALLIRARSIARDGKLDRADAMLSEARALLPAQMLPRDRYRFVAAQAFVKDESGKLEDAVRLCHEALALADQADDLWRRSEARVALAHAYEAARQFERARALTQDALALAEKARDWVALARAHNMAALVADDLGDIQGERRSFELASDYAHRAGAKIDEALYLANMADFFLKNGDYKTALAHAERALPLTRELKDTNSETVALANIGMAHISLQRIELGKRYVREALAIDERRGSLGYVSVLLQEFGSYLEKAGDLPGAVAAYHRHRQLARGILRDEDQKAILGMQEQYDADQRTRSLAVLNRENDVKVEQLRRRDLQQRLWWLLAATFVLSFAVVVLLVRRVRQTNRRLASSNELLKVQSERDPLTGLANRRHFQAAMRQLAADGKLSGTVYLIDIDHFKRINDRHGHGAGDTVLVEVARRLRETLREEDLIVRWGGEEFLVVVQALAPDQVDALAQRMLDSLDQTPVTAGLQRIAVTASIGFATFPIGPASLRVTWERAINLVDTAMYLAKAHGRNRAYGVHLLHARDEDALTEITRSLETAWREGQVTLTQLQGRAPNVAVAVAA
jgi:diguanylate cyclase (GGDEF)-like protein